ncbi:MAG TPA: methyltransferase domain-containing protein [Acidimicrobiales bacterium]|nr:methyltransferase domain-containing protein [Acidimicrobiales bacterium]
MGAASGYENSAAAYDVLHGARGKDYRREAEVVVDRIRRHLPGAGSILDVACGTGLHLASFAELGFDVEGVDLSGSMIEEARRRVPGTVLHEGDMRTFRLARRFDAVVCLFSAIGYMRTRTELATALTTMADHLVDGGVLVVEPWLRPDNWHDGRVFAEGAEAGGLAVARVSRSWREGDESLIEMHYALARRDRTWSFTEVHRMGLMTTATQLEVYRDVGLVVEHEHPGLTDRGLFVAVKPPATT